MSRVNACLVLLVIGRVSCLCNDVTAQEILDPNYRAPRTAGQVPDISGIWRNDTLTPFERPIGLGDQAYLSEEEAAFVEDRGADARTIDNAPGGR